MQAVNYGNDPAPQPKDAKQLHMNEAGGQQQEAQQGGEQEFEGKTIGDALEIAAAKAGDKPLELKDVRAIQSAEARATGVPSGVLGGPSQYAQTLLASGGEHTLGEALTDAKAYLPADKVATHRDANRIQQAEQRNDPMGRVDPGGVGACVREAVEENVAKGVIPPADPSVPAALAARSTPRP